MQYLPQTLQRAASNQLSARPRRRALPHGAAAGFGACGGAFWRGAMYQRHTGQWNSLFQRLFFALRFLSKCRNQPAICWAGSYCAAFA